MYVTIDRFFFTLNAWRFQVSHTYEDFMDLSLSIRSEDDKDSKVNKDTITRTH